MEITFCYLLKATVLVSFLFTTVVVQSQDFDTHGVTYPRNSRYNHYAPRPYNNFQHQQSPPVQMYPWISGTFYNQHNYRGLPMSYFFRGDSCVNFPENHQMISLKPFGCIMLFKRKHCKGQASMVARDMADLNEVGMSDGIASLKNCFYQSSSSMRFPDY